jgi:hypothetical protein
MGQQPNAPERPHLVMGKVVDGDTIPHVYLPDVPVFGVWKNKNDRQYARYSRLVNNVKKALPYARLASQKLKEINEHMASLKTEKEREAYLKIAEKQLFKEFETPLKKLTYTQGRILIKLIDRETGDTSYDLIKDYKGGFSAFFWQSVAKVFGSNLKSEYDPKGDDKSIEHIVNLIDSGLL